MPCWPGTPAATSAEPWSVQRRSPHDLVLDGGAVARTPGVHPAAVDGGLGQVVLRSAGVSSDYRRSLGGWISLVKPAGRHCSAGECSGPRAAAVGAGRQGGTVSQALQSHPTLQAIPGHIAFRLGEERHMWPLPSSSHPMPFGATSPSSHPKDLVRLRRGVCEVAGHLGGGGGAGRGEAAGLAAQAAALMHHAPRQRPGHTGQNTGRSLDARARHHPTPPRQAAASPSRTCGRGTRATGSKLNHRTRSSPGCASKPEKSIVRRSTRAGVPAGAGAGRREGSRRIARCRAAQCATPRLASPPAGPAVTALHLSHLS